MTVISVIPCLSEAIAWTGRKALYWLFSPVVLTPIERWEALRQAGGDVGTNRWFIFFGLVTVIILTVLLVVISLRRTRVESKSSEELFAEYAEKRGLSDRERQILLLVTGHSKVRRSESIFTMRRAFERGAAKLIEQKRAAGQKVEAIKQLETELSFLREKLGYKKRLLFSTSLSGRRERPDSRQIPVGKQLHLTRRTDGSSAEIGSTVIENNNDELRVRLTEPVKITFNEFWRARYYFGASVWEFDTSVTSYDGQMVGLRHSDTVRFVNRRRFLRVPVNKQGFIAQFPFKRVIRAGVESSVEAGQVSERSVPEFVPAVISELAGPGLRVETRLELAAGERVLVVFKPDEEAGKHENFQTAEAGQMVIEDIGEVRHITSTGKGLSVAIELTGLRESDLNELIRCTNEAARRAGIKGGGSEGSADLTEQALESAVFQDV